MGRIATGTASAMPADGHGWGSGLVDKNGQYSQPSGQNTQKAALKAGRSGEKGWLKRLLEKSTYPKSEKVDSDPDSALSHESHRESLKKCATGFRLDSPLRDANGVMCNFRFLHRSSRAKGDCHIFFQTNFTQYPLTCTESRTILWAEFLLRESVCVLLYCLPGLRKSLLAIWHVARLVTPPTV